MAQRSIREFQAKRLLAEHLPEVSKGKFKLETPRVLVQDSKELAELAKDHAWLREGKLVVKPDQMIGKKDKNKLMVLNVPVQEAVAFVEKSAGKKVTIGKNTGTLTHFLVEPFVSHKEEFYVALLTGRENDTILFSPKGGVDIEENWESVSKLEVPTNARPTAEQLHKLVAAAPSAQKDILAKFIAALYELFVKLGFSYLEINPFALVHDNPVPLGTVARIDDTSGFEHIGEWGEMEFPAPFGRELSPEEAFVKGLDEKTGASLKLTILNPNGAIWPMVAGGGASVVYADAIATENGSELAIYGEYSGDPTEEDTYQYARTILSLLVKSKAKRKALLIGGGIANFTNVTKTFLGIIRALHEKATELKKANVHLYVRRGGPYYREGLAAIRDAAAKDGLPIEVYGPETPMTRIVGLAAKWIKEKH